MYYVECIKPHKPLLNLQNITSLNEIDERNQIIRCFKAGTSYGYVKMEYVLVSNN